VELCQNQRATAEAEAPAEAAQRAEHSGAGGANVETVLGISP